jgi:uncharacterized membrane protein YraQ (UPF0718 family)
MAFLHNLMAIYLDAAFWLVIGLLFAGLLKAWMPADLLQRQLGQGRLAPTLKAALIGAPLPLCSCGVLPAALGLRRAGASNSATVSFMIATPETGPDSIALSYALLGPIMAVARPLAALFSAITTGLLTSLIPEASPLPSTLPVAVATGNCCSKPANQQQPLLSSLHYAFVDMLDDILLWLAAGLILAALVMTFIPPTALAEVGSGPLTMLLMLVVGIPMYICATASTPLAAAMLAAGLSPGAVLVFLLAGPATNLATMGVIGKEMGRQVLLAYLLGIAASSLLMGVALDVLLEDMGWVVDASVAGEQEWLPDWLKHLAGVGLLTAALASARRSLKQR